MAWIGVREEYIFLVLNHISDDSDVIIDSLYLDRDEMFHYWHYHRSIPLCHQACGEVKGERMVLSVGDLSGIWRWQGFFKITTSITYV